MSGTSAGLLMYRIRLGGVEVLLVHPGGPYFKNKDEGAWSIPKGEIEPDEDLLRAAQREFEEEIGIKPTGPYTALVPVRQKGGKIVHAWAVEQDGDPEPIISNTFMIEWPPRSGHKEQFPEVDKAQFFNLTEAKRKINAAQVAFLDELQVLVDREA